ncbi:hypothetical protein [Zunongwangia sp.]|uniref:hypothetical protein n=1 Tax=Zunongwangia sp. TaxID=1965325 RepID=UPI003AA8F14E
MKLLYSITILLFMIMNSALAQDSLSTNKQEPKLDILQYPIHYCSISPSHKTFSSHVEIKIDYGQDDTLIKNTYIRNETGEKRVFNSIIQALNYMKSLGWNLIKAYQVHNPNNTFSERFLFEAEEQAILPENG